MDISKLLDKSDEFKICNFLYKIEGDDLKETISSLRAAKIPKPHLTYKDVLKEQIELKFQLNPNDTILFLDDFIYVKKFLHVESKTSEERRSCGISVEVLKAYKEKYFKDDSHKKVILNLLSSVIEDTLSFKRIDPLTFSKIFIPIFVNMFEILIIEHTDIEDDVVVKGFGFYLLREMFDEMMLCVAEDILFNFSNKDRKAIEFLSFFSSNEKIDSKGVRYKARPILDESNHAWNMSTIRSTMIQHTKAKQDFYDKTNALISIKKKLESYVYVVIDLNKKIKEEELKHEKIDKQIESIKNTLRKLEETDTKTIKYIEDDVEKTYEKKPLIVKLFKKEDGLIHEKTLLKKDREVMELQVENKKKEIATWQKKYNEGKELLATIATKGHPTDELYSRIKKALAKTLTKR